MKLFKVKQCIHALVKIITSGKACQHFIHMHQKQFSEKKGPSANKEKPKRSRRFCCDHCACVNNCYKMWFSAKIELCKSNQKSKQMQNKLQYMQFPSSHQLWGTHIHISTGTVFIQKQNKSKSQRPTMQLLSKFWCTILLHLCIRVQLCTVHDWGLNICTERTYYTIDPCFWKIWKQREGKSRQLNIVSL